MGLVSEELRAGGRELMMAAVQKEQNLLLWGIVAYCDHLDGLYTYKSRSRTFELPIWRNTIDENGIASLMVPGAVAK